MKIHSATQYFYGFVGQHQPARNLCKNYIEFQLNQEAEFAKNFYQKIF